MPEFIEIKGLTKKYRLGREIITALNDVDLMISEGEFLCILGTSGSGKTTLLHIMAGLERPNRGEVTIRGTNLTKMKEKDMAFFRRRYMGFIFQSYHLIPTLTAMENVALPLLFDCIAKKERVKRAKDILIQLGLQDRLKNKPMEMSGGQQQRVSIARAMVNNPKIIFADEPTGNLDSKISKEIMSILTQKVKASGVTLIMVTHDLEIAEYADRVLHMVDGEIVKITEKEGNLEGKIVFSYIDNNNKNVLVENPFTMNIQARQESSVSMEGGKTGSAGIVRTAGPGKGAAQQQAGIGKKIIANWPYLILGLAIILQGVYIWRMKRKKASEEFFHE